MSAFALQGACAASCKCSMQLLLFQAIICSLTDHTSCSFGQYTKDEASTFNLLPEMTYYPGFMFHLRRSQFVQVC